MKICLMSDASALHTVRWANALVARGHELDLITMSDTGDNIIDPRVTIHRLNYDNPRMNKYEVRSLLRNIQPDIMHAYDASNYGTLARHANYKPYVLSAWGTDIYLYPNQSKRHEKRLCKNLRAAAEIISTSKAMCTEVKTYVQDPPPIKIIPFGVDTTLFRSTANSRSDNSTITIGTVKNLYAMYGVDTLINTFVMLLNGLRENDEKELANLLHLRIVGDGPDRDHLERLVAEHEIADITEFVGAVSNEKVPAELEQIDIYCALSRSESFGVSVLEASACNVPVIVSSIGGLPEVIKDGETGYLVDRENKPQIIERLYELASNPKLRSEMGENGREFVENNYNWQGSIEQIEELYKSLIK